MLYPVQDLHIEDYEPKMAPLLKKALMGQREPSCPAIEPALLLVLAPLIALQIGEALGMAAIPRKTHPQEELAVADWDVF